MRARRPGDTAIGIGLVAFVVGLGFIAADVIPFFAGSTDRPLWLNLSCLLAPLGFALVVAAALRRGRAEQRAAELAVRETGATDPAVTGRHDTMDSPVQ